jgi:hypothetical protein
MGTCWSDWFPEPYSARSLSGTEGKALHRDLQPRRIHTLGAITRHNRLLTSHLSRVRPEKEKLDEYRLCRPGHPALCARDQWVTFGVLAV